MLGQSLVSQHGPRGRWGGLCEFSLPACYDVLRIHVDTDEAVVHVLLLAGCGVRHCRAGEGAFI